MALRELALFAGAGGGILGGILCGFRTVCACEIDSYCRSVLLQRQIDKCLDPFPIWDDVETFDGHPWRGSVDVISAGWPCQDISTAGKGAGLDGKRSGLWVHVARILGEVLPPYAILENSPALTCRGLGRVLGDLASLGYDARWGVLGARHVGAPHKRDRIWIVASNPDRDREPVKPVDDSPLAGVSCVAADAAGFRLKRHHDANPGAPGDEKRRVFEFIGKSGWPAEPDVGRVVPDGLAPGLDKHRAERLRAIGNGQVPRVVDLAWAMLGPGSVDQGSR